MQKLAIIITHPIQYYAPVFKLLHEQQQIGIKVFYTWGEAAQHKFDPGFGKKISWDIPLLDGYPYEWVNNTSANPGSSNYKGIINPGLVKQIASWRPDAILVFGWSFKSHLNLLRYFKGKVPLFFRGDSNLLDNRPWLKNKLRWLVLKWVYSFIDHAFYTGTNNFNYYKKFGLNDSQLSFAPHAVDNNRFSEDRSNEVSQLRAGLGIKEADTLLLFAGKFEVKKDPLLLLNAFLRLDASNAHLLFVGNGDLRGELTSLVQNERVHFMDFQNQTQMPVFYQACDLFCLPSKGPGETWGLAVNEAMACGKAILVSDKVGCAVDLVKPGINGYIFRAGNERELHQYLSKLTTSKKSLQDFGKQSAEIIKNWNFAEIAREITYRTAKIQKTFNRKNAS
ncbi:glycosyltransferase involved in cell wall biosynthesis [Mucilaginibacter sp. UYP25]|uniref:glycosyltransferase family 4 protein n=1 Tax=unclassified Mucilaginibacter TaxID=2617802 RepID=UPI0033974DDA